MSFASSLYSFVALSHVFWGFLSPCLPLAFVTIPLYPPKHLFLYAMRSLRPRGTSDLQEPSLSPCEQASDGSLPHVFTSRRLGGDRAQRKPRNEWERIRPYFKQLYGDEDLSLKEVMMRLRTEYGFEATLVFPRSFYRLIPARFRLCLTFCKRESIQGEIEEVGNREESQDNGDAAYYQDPDQTSTGNSQQRDYIQNTPTASRRSENRTIQERAQRIVDSIVQYVLPSTENVPLVD